MVDFRRWITALAVLALFAGLASAQVQGAGSTGALACTANVAVPPQLRSEGLTDLIGDIVITCSGGASLTAGSVIPTANFTVSLATQVTSRIITGTNISESMLIIDEPGSGLVPQVTGFGPGAGQIPCAVSGALSTVGAGVGGCQEFAGVDATTGLPVALAASGGSTPGPNVFFGAVNGSNQVVFNGIPILGPVSSTSTRVFRITNIRANISGIGGGGLPGITQLLASVSISGNTSVPVNNPTVVAGFIQAGLTTQLRNAINNGNLSGSGASFNQCSNANTAGVAVLQYIENFGTAFKTRVAPTANYNGQSQGTTVTAQNIPGTIYNSESGFVFNGAPGVSATPGQADFGTRLKAVFNNVPTGVRLFVSVANLAVNTYQATVTAPTSNTSVSSFAQLVSGETVVDGNGYVPAVSSTSMVNGSPGVTGIAEIPVVGGSAVAVWEVVNTNPAQQETFQFGVWATYSANPGNNSPPPGTATVNMSYAPISTNTSASSTAPVPRFADTSSAKNIMVINICQTLLLFPYVTNQAGFDTGIAIANTSTDPVGTGAQSGKCALTWYDGTGKTPASDTGTIATGTVYTNLASVLAPGFQGYMFALCNFQWAHGFAFISDLGARNLAMGYLALIVNNGSVSRGPAAEALGN